MPMFDPYRGGGTTPNWSGFDPNRVQNRISFLQKNRPKDQSIGKFQDLLNQYNQYQKGQGQQADTNSGQGASTGNDMLSGNPFGQTAQDSYNAYNEWSKQNQPSFDNAPKLPGVDDFAAERQRIEGQLYDRARSDLDQRYKTMSDEFEQTMANQGVDIGSERYKREKELFTRNQNQAYSDARFDALRNAGAEQSRLFGDALSARQQGVDETTSLRTQRLADLAAALNPATTFAGYKNQRDTARDQINATLEQQQRDQRFRRRENQLDRNIERQKISKMGRSGGGDGGGLDMKVIMDLVNQLTGGGLSQ